MLFRGSHSYIVVVAFISAVIACIVLASTTYYFYLKTNVQTKEYSPENEIESLVMEVNKLIVLPEDEVPTIATVSNVEVLRSQDFFRRAKDGDKVLIYSIAGKAILYDPIAKKIVEVAPVNPSANISENTDSP